MMKMADKYCKICKREHGIVGVNCNWCKREITCRQKKILIDENTIQHYEEVTIHNVFHKGCYNKMINSRKDKYEFEV